MVSLKCTSEYITFRLTSEKVNRQGYLFISDLLLLPGKKKKDFANEFLQAYSPTAPTSAIPGLVLHWPVTSAAYQVLQTHPACGYWAFPRPFIPCVLPERHPGDCFILFRSLLKCHLRRERILPIPASMPHFLLVWLPQHFLSSNSQMMAYLAVWLFSL